MNETLAILCFFIAGALCGYYDLAPDFILRNDLSLAALWAFMGIAGIMLGRDRRIGELFKTLKPTLLLLPAATTVGTFLGSAICSLFIAYNIYECLAIGAGFAYYSLSSIFISRELGEEAGAVALLANVSRELLTIVLAGTISRFFGPQALISCGGAASMDTVLGVVMRNGGRQWVLPSLAHGIVMDFSVPFWIAIFCPLALNLR